MNFSKHVVGVIHQHSSDVRAAIDSATYDAATTAINLHFPHPSNCEVDRVINYIANCELHISKILLAIPLSFITYDGSSPNNIRFSSTKNMVIQSSVLHLNRVLYYMTQLFQLLVTVKLYHDVSNQAIRKQLMVHFKLIRTITDDLEQLNDTIGTIDASEIKRQLTTIVDDCVRLRHICASTSHTFPSIAKHHYHSVDRYKELLDDRSSVYRIEYVDQALVGMDATSGIVVIQEQQILDQLLISIVSEQPNLSSTTF